jgi:N-acetylneuraminate synthase
MRHCESRDIGFLSTPFDVVSARFLVEELGLGQLKIPSGEITNGILLLAMARLSCPVILSTGMSTLGEIEDALGFWHLAT